MISYELPEGWVLFDKAAVFDALVEAKSAVASLASIPSQREWVEELQELELKREVAGTSRIEGAEFTERELDAALAESPTELATRSQRQARAAVRTYRWVARLAPDRPIDSALILEIHRRVVEGADDDHCPPGKIRTRDQNVLFGTPRHRGAEGGSECAEAFEGFATAIERELRDHDPLIRALAAHYHLVAMHPFLDGNGRTGRALEALMLQRAGLRDTCFIAMSNYYYDEKTTYLAVLAEARARGHDLTPFLVFALRGIATQSNRLLAEIRHQLSKGIFRNLMFDLFGRLRTPKRRVIAGRQIEILKLLLEGDPLPLSVVEERTRGQYADLKNPQKALFRDLNALFALGAAEVTTDQKTHEHRVRVRLEWPSEITETEFFKRIQEMPKAKSHPFLT